jgi:hypothetical protein
VLQVLKPNQGRTFGNFPSTIQVPQVWTAVVALLLNSSELVALLYGYSGSPIDEYARSCTEVAA